MAATLNRAAITAVSRAMAAQPAFARAARALKTAYGTEITALVREMGAKLAAAKFARLGMDRETGLTLLKAYYSELAAQYGTEAANRILRNTDRRVAHDATIRRNR